MYGWGDATAATPVAPVPPAVQINYNSPYGETFWDFLSASSALSPTQLVTRYKVAIGVGVVGFVGFLMLFRKGTA